MMNDEEIINEINEILVYLEDEGEYHLDKDCDTEWLLAVKEVLNLFNREQAEIERLTRLLAQWKKVAYKYIDAVENIKSEAIKEFAERLKEKQRTFIGDEYAYEFIPSIEIDVLLAEMAGEQNA